MTTNNISSRLGVVARLVMAGVIAIVAVAFLGGAAAQPTDSTLEHQGEHSGPPTAEEAFVVHLDDDGDANITWTMSVMNLSDDAEAEVFQDLQSDSEWQQKRVEKFESQWQSIVTDASQETGREMAVRNTAIEFEKVENKGIIRLSLTWEGLAATSGEELELTEPFVTMSESPWPLYVELPDGYESTTVDAETEPADRSENYLAWNAESDLSGFTLAATESAESPDGSSESDGGTDGTDGSADGAGPGFGAIAVLVGLVGAVLLAARR